MDLTKKWFLAYSISPTLHQFLNCSETRRNSISGYHSKTNVRHSILNVRQKLNVNVILLSSLELVSSFWKVIKENKHLFGMPSAKEVATDGIEIIECNKKLLKKMKS